MAHRLTLILAATLTFAAPQPLLSQTPSSAFWPKFIAGFFTSLAAHEAAHVTSSLVMGYTPGLGFDAGRPVIHSGIDEARHHTAQFIFSASGMTTQLVLNEVLLDWPHHGQPASAFTKGMLASGVGTVLFYFTIGRSSNISDVQLMADNSSLSKWELAAIFGGVAATDVVRVLINPRYAHFFAAPTSNGIAAGGRISF